jgi:hypothetical protein
VAQEEIAVAVGEARAVAARTGYRGTAAPSPRGRLLSWSSLQAGQAVVLRGKRTPGEVPVTIERMLPRVLGDGLGLVAQDGTEYRQYYYDVREPLTP